VNATHLPQSFLVYRRYLYLKASVLVALVTLIVYYTRFPSSDHRGGSTIGYTLGIVAAVLMVWLTWFSRRKRRYAPARVPLADWLSAHVYVGLVALPLLAGLHCGFHFGWNVHSLAYFLMLACILSGVVGVGIYASVPASMTRDRPDGRVADLLGQVGQLDQDCRALAVGGNLPDAFLREVLSALSASTRKRYIREAAIPLLFGPDPTRIASAATRRIRNAAVEESDEPRAVVNQLLEQLERKEMLLRQVYAEARGKAWLRVWLAAHVPLAWVALATLVIHIIAELTF